MTRRRHSGYDVLGPPLVPIPRVAAPGLPGVGRLAAPLPSTVARAARLNVSFPEPGRCSGRPADHYVLTDLWRSPAATSERSIDHLMFGQMPALVSTSAMVAAPAGPLVLDSRVQIKFRTARDLRLRLRVAAATTERTQDEILAEALAEGSRSPTWRGVPQAGS